jgi:photosystem II stability/assembly factor-like uncharacterized protein
MRTDSELRSEFRSALEAVTPAAPWLAHTVRKGLGTRPSTRRGAWAPLQLRFGLNVVAVLVLIGLAVAAVGVYLNFHQAVVPAHPGVGRLFSPTKMMTASIGWSWVDRSGLWRTADGGARWTDVSPPALPDRIPDTTYANQLGFNGISYSDPHFLLDATHAWIAESGQGAAGGSGHYLTTFRTADGGKTWHEGASIGALPAFGPALCGTQRLPACSTSPFDQVPLFPQLFFVDSNHGWLLLPSQGSPPTASTPTLYSTDDAGLHWTLTSTSAHTGTMTFSSRTTGWILATDRGLPALLVTHDGGVRWEVQPLPVTLDSTGFLGVPEFFDPQHGLILASFSSVSPLLLLVTSDGGGTWIVRTVPQDLVFGVWVDFVDAAHGWVIAGSATDFDAVPGVALPLYKTDDGGLTWDAVPTTVVWRSRASSPPMGPIDILDFVDQNNGFAIRERYMANGLSQLLKTTDGGRTWTVVEALQTP